MKNFKLEKACRALGVNVMTPKFKVGDKVRAVESCAVIVAGEVYTVKEVNINNIGVERIRVSGAR